MVESSHDLRLELGGMPMQERIFGISGKNKGLRCPFKLVVFCQEGYCHGCQIYLGWQKLGGKEGVRRWNLRIVLN